MKKFHILYLLSFFGLTIAARSIDLSGTWKFVMGEKPEYNDSIHLPGSMLTNGKGLPVTTETQWVGSLYDSSFYFNPYMAKYREPGKMKFPFFLTPDRHYVGYAWYERSVDIPRDWKGNRVLLHLERPHIETCVFINGQEAGRDSSLSVPHQFDITPYVKPGQTNTIAVRIYNGIENVAVGQDSHSVTDQTQGDWNGIVGRMELQCLPKSYISDLQIYPNIDNNTIKVRGHIDGPAAKHNVQFSCTAPDGKVLQLKPLKVTTDTFCTVLPMGDDVQLWDEFNPALYTLSTTLDKGHTRHDTFGMRKISIKGRQFYVNGNPVWMRGTVGNCCFPLTGYPPTEVEPWLEIFNKCKEYGLNCMRFHSYCPPEAAFVAADQVGFYLQPEGPSWPNHGIKLGNGMAIDHYLLEETVRMTEQYGNHPSFCMLAAGNEPAGNWVKWVTDFTDYWRSTGDDRRVYCGASVGGGWAFDPGSDYHVKGGARGLNWDKTAPQSADDYYAQITSFTQKGRNPITFEINEPLISHEKGQWCAFPDFKETSQYTGAYKAGNFDIFADLLESNGMASQAEKFLMASGRLQTLAYKYEIERNLRTPEYAGFVLLGLNDYSGQGTALVGVLNVFWREKGYCDAAQWTEFCSPVVPLAKFPKFVYSPAEQLNVPVELYNAYKPLTNVTVTYDITTPQGSLLHQTLSTADTPLGKCFELPTVKSSLASIKKPTKCTLTATVNYAGAEQPAKNHWEFWVYPPSDITEPDDILVTDTLDEKAKATLAAGGKVLINAAGKVHYGNDVKQTYLPVFWNTSWFKMRPPHTTGAVIDTEHPLFKYFESDDWANLNWWELLNKAQVINLSQFPKSYQPPVQPIDTWHVSRKLGMIAEANVLGGKLLITTIDLERNLDKRLVAQAMQKAIFDYMSSPDFNPSLTLDPETITNLFECEAPAVNMFTNDSPDELKPKLK